MRKTIFARVKLNVFEKNPDNSNERKQKMIEANIYMIALNKNKQIFAAFSLQKIIKTILQDWDWMSLTQIISSDNSFELIAVMTSIFFFLDEKKNWSSCQWCTIFVVIVILFSFLMVRGIITWCYVVIWFWEIWLYMYFSMNVAHNIHFVLVWHWMNVQMQIISQWNFFEIQWNQLNALSLQYGP